MEWEAAITESQVTLRICDPLQDNELTTIAVYTALGQTKVPTPRSELRRGDLRLLAFREYSVSHVSESVTIMMSYLRWLKTIKQAGPYQVLICADQT